MITNHAIGGRRAARMGVLGIDASNLRDGGGISHLRELLTAANPERYQFSEVIVWGGKTTLGHLPNRPWLRRVKVSAADAILPRRLVWQNVLLPIEARKRCELLFVPGGNYHGRGIRYVTMSRNLLPFDPVEQRRYSWSASRMRLNLLHHGQIGTFRRANGVIFLSNYAKEIVTTSTGYIPSSRTIPHGVNELVRLHPRGRLREGEPMRILYPSPVKPYKHQWNVIEAVAKIRHKSGIELSLDLVGSGEPKSLERMDEARKRFDPDNRFVRYHGRIPHSELINRYHRADAMVFASTCENLPNIVIEGMAAGLPIASSNRHPMPEVLADACVYFDPESPSEIEIALGHFLLNPARRYELAMKAYRRAMRYSWRRCADETFGYLRYVADTAMPD